MKLWFVYFVEVMSVRCENCLSKETKELSSQEPQKDHYVKCNTGMAVVILLWCIGFEVTIFTTYKLIMLLVNNNEGHKSV